MMMVRTPGRHCERAVIYVRVIFFVLFATPKSERSMIVSPFLGENKMEHTNAISVSRSATRNDVSVYDGAADRWR